MNDDSDDLFWRYLGGQPPDPAFSDRLASDPVSARRLAELALIECDLREVMARRPQGWVRERRGVILWAGLGIGLAAVFMVLATRVSPREPDAPDGSVVAAPKDVRSRAMAADLQKGNPVQVTGDPLDLRFAGESTRLILEAGTEAQMLALADGGRELQMNRGNLLADMAPQKAPFWVKTPHLTLEVVGTKFNVQTAEDATEVVVQEGAVRMDAAGLKGGIRLPGGSGWRQAGPGEGFSVAAVPYASRSESAGQDGEEIWTKLPAYPNRFDETKPGVAQRSDADHASFWKARWDEDALWVRVEVTDDQDGRGKAAVWMNDSIEVFVDADNSRTAKFDGADDRMLFFEPGREEITPGVGSLPAPAGVTHRSERKERGFWTEVRFPWDALGVRPRAGLRLGFNVASNDADPGEGGRSQRSWTALRRGDWSCPNRMGILILSPPPDSSG